MQKIILHHYPASPFAEKVRLLMGFKNLAWHSVTVPNILPKPKLTELTGGYRKTPVMQVGKDIYCDTKMITSYLEKHFPDPSFFPATQRSNALKLSHWADIVLFNCVVPLVFSPRGQQGMLAMGRTQQQIDALFNDRTALRGKRQPLAYATALNQLHVHLQSFEAQLNGGAPYVMGDNPSLADICHYHPLFLLSNVPDVNQELENYPAIKSWQKRVKQMGHGDASELTSEQAIAIAADSQHFTAPLETDYGNLANAQIGDKVTVKPVDTGSHNPVSGVLVIASTNEIAIQRSSNAAGEVRVHFPSADFEVELA